MPRKKKVVGALHTPGRPTVHVREGEPAMVKRRDELMKRSAMFRRRDALMKATAEKRRAASGVDRGTSSRRSFPDQVLHRTRRRRAR